MEFAAADSFGHNMNVHVAMRILEERCGYQFTFVSDQQIEKGVLSKYKLMLMPCSLVIGDKVGTKLKEFVENGGTLIADVRPGILDGDGKWDTSQKVPSLFGLSFKKSMGREMVSSELKGNLPSGTISILLEQELPVDPSLELKGAKPLCTLKGIPVVTINSCGNGKAVCLNIPFTYYKGRTMPDCLYGYKGDEGHNQVIKAILELLLKESMIKRPVEVEPADGGVWPYGLDVSLHNDGEAQYIGVSKARESDSEIPREICIRLKHPSYVYDMFGGKFLGGPIDVFKTTVRSSDVQLFAALPSKVKSLKGNLDSTSVSRGGTLSGTVKLELDGTKASRHVINLQVFRPDGKLVQYLTQNLEAIASVGVLSLVGMGGGPRAEFKIPIALNEPSGDWTLRFSDLASGEKSEVKFTVGKNE